MLEGAEMAFRRAVDAAPGEARFRLALADTLDRRGRADEALAGVWGLIAGGVRDRRTLGRLGHLLARAGNFGGAEQAYRQAIEVAPDEAGFQFALAEMLDRGGRPEEAVAILRSVAAKAGHDRQAYQRLGELLSRTGDLAGADEALHRAADGGR